MESKTFNEFMKNKNISESDKRRFCADFLVYGGFNELYRVFLLRSSRSSRSLIEVRTREAQCRSLKKKPK